MNAPHCCALQPVIGAFHPLLPMGATCISRVQYQRSPRDGQYVRLISSVPGSDREVLISA